MKEKISSNEVSGLFMVGIPGGPLKKETVDFLNKYPVAGVILFARNAGSRQELSSLVRNIRKAVNREILVSIDHEGGVVQRIRKGMTVLPGNMALASTRNLEMAREYGRIQGEELRACDIDINLAPVLDINDNPANPGIGVRSFGDSPGLVSKFGEAVIMGMMEAGIMPCAKHFPGKGKASLDSHISLPRIDQSLQAMQRNELAPFRKAISCGVPLVMTSHAWMPALDSQATPGTLSENMVTGLLKNRMGFQGTVITDDMEMGAIEEKFGSDEAILKAFRAGCDMLLVCHDRNKVIAGIERIVEAINREPALFERFLDARERVERLFRARSAGRKKYKIDSGKLKKNMSVAENITRSAISVVCGKRYIPLRLPPEIILYPSPERLTPVEEYAVSVIPSLFRKKFKKADFVVYSPKDDEIDEGLVSKCDGKRVLLMTSNAHLKTRAKDVLKKIVDVSAETYHVALRNPYDTGIFRNSKIRITTCCSNEIALEGVIDVLEGRMEAAGSLPVKIPVEN